MNVPYRIQVLEQAVWDALDRLAYVEKALEEQPLDPARHRACHTALLDLTEARRALRAANTLLPANFPKVNV